MDKEVLTERVDDLRLVYGLSFLESYKNERDEFTPQEELVIISYLMKPDHAFAIRSGALVNRFSELFAQLVDTAANIEPALHKLWQSRYDEVFNQFEQHAQACLDDIFYKELAGNGVANPDEFNTMAMVTTLVRMLGRVCTEVYHALEEEPVTEVVDNIMSFRINEEHSRNVALAYVLKYVYEQFHLSAKALDKNPPQNLINIILGKVTATASVIADVNKTPSGLYAPNGISTIGIESAHGIYYGKPYTLHENVDYAEFIAAVYTNPSDEYEIHEESDLDKLNILMQDLDYGQIVTDESVDVVIDTVSVDCNRYLLEVIYDDSATYVAFVMRPSSDGKWQIFVTRPQD